MNDYKYLDLLGELGKKLDNKQRAVCCRTQNTIVAAGAGSGKTQVLATRFAWLVMSEGIKASEILTLTFTKKAAGEMYERIYQTLSFFAEHEQTPSLEKQRANQALAEFSETHIQTLDSYCASIVKQAANRYGIRPDFSSGSNDSDSQIQELALPFVFENRDRLCIKTFAQTGQLQDFSSSVLAKAVSSYTSLADEPDFFASKFTAQEKILLQAWNELICGSIPSESKSVLPENTMNFIDASNYLLQEHKNALEKKGETPYLLGLNNIISIIQEFETKSGTHLEELIPYAKTLELLIKELFVFKGNTPGYTSEIRKAVKAFKENFSQTAISLCSYILQVDAIKDLFALFDEFTAKVNQSKRISGNLTFRDVSELALKILYEQEDLRKQEQDSFKKIMIDEFQDNNAKNRDLLFLLANNEQKLFFVGDEKQSIYKFRGADVSVFNQLKKDLGSENFLQMSYNYRSCPELIASFNRIFGGEKAIFDNSTEKLFEARYSTPAIVFDPATQTEKEEAVLNDESFKLSVILLDKEDIKDKKVFFGEKDQNAIFICKQILSKINQAKKENKPVPSFSDFAILDKGRTDRKYFIKWLNYFNIPYTMDQNTSLFSDGPINDIYNFLQLCVFPNDKISLAGYLSSPFANLSEQAVECILSDGNIEEELPSETDCYNQAMKTFEEQRLLTLARPLTKTISVLWNDFAYRYETLRNTNTFLYAEQFDMLFELARQAEDSGKNISWFVEQLGGIKNRELSSFAPEVEINADELSYPVEKGDAVQIMTIHKSKGLQFPYVFVYGCTQVSSGDKDSNFFFDEDIGLTIKTESKVKNFFYKIQEEEALQKSLAEFRRLIYVAITRGINEVTVIGAWSKDEKEADTRDNSFRLFENLTRFYCSPENEAKKPALFLTFTPAKREDYPFTNDNQNLQEELKHIELAKQFYSKEPAIPYIWPESRRKTPSSLEKGYILLSSDYDGSIKYEEPSDLLQNADFAANDFGTLVHAYLENQANGINPQDFIPDVKLLKTLNEEQKQEVTKTCIKMCQEFAKSKFGILFEDAKQKGRFFKAEWAFRMMHKNDIFTGSIDLIFQNEDGTYTIIDYKSDSTMDFEKYIMQQYCYKIAASKLLNIEPEKIKTLLYFLRFQKYVNLSEIPQEQQKMEL